MSTNSISVKHTKHRVHPCPNDKKLSLLNLLVAQNSKMKIFIACANSFDTVQESVNADNVTVLSDDELIKSNDLQCQLLISYDLPSTASLYMTRLEKATEMALILLDSSEQKNLYPIETLLGRAIKQEIIEGFEYEDNQSLKVAQKPLEKQKREYAFNPDSEQKPKKWENKDKKPFEKPKYDKPKYDKPKREGSSDDKPKKWENKDKKSFEKPKYDKPKYDKPKREGSSDDKPKKWENKDKKPNKFLGKDENGKAMFSGKSGERNHRHDGTAKEKYDAPKKVGRKISIKERKPKETPES